MYAVHIQESGQLPDFIVKAFDEESKKADNPRKYKSSIINNLFVKGDDGSFTMDLQNEKIVAATTEVERKEAARKEKRMRKTVFLASVFNGRADLLQKAIGDGE